MSSSKGINADDDNVYDNDVDDNDDDRWYMMIMNLCNTYNYI